MKSLIFIAGFIFIAVFGYSKEFFESRMEYWNKSPEAVVAFEKLSKETELIKMYDNPWYMKYAIKIYDEPCTMVYKFSTNDDLDVIDYYIPMKYYEQLKKIVEKKYEKNKKGQMYTSKYFTIGLMQLSEPNDGIFQFIFIKKLESQSGTN